MTTARMRSIIPNKIQGIQENSSNNALIFAIIYTLVLELFLFYLDPFILCSFSSDSGDKLHSLVWWGPFLTRAYHIKYIKWVKRPEN